jgi:predicted nucleic acid-binding protein
MLVIDATTLLLLFDPTASPPRDPSTKRPLDKCKERIQFLLTTLNDSGTRVIVPTPVLSELLVRAGDAKPQLLSEITNSPSFVVAPFDLKSAVELSFLLEAQKAIGKKKMSDRETWAKLKFDRQIIAIAKSHSAKTIYSDDIGLGSVAKLNGIRTIHTWELPLPPVAAQAEFDLQ